MAEGNWGFLEQRLIYAPDVAACSHLAGNWSIEYQGGLPNGGLHTGRCLAPIALHPLAFLNCYVFHE